MTVREYALKQLHAALQKDPWIQAVMLAAGQTLDSLAERILALYNSDDFGAMDLAQVRRYESLLGIPYNDTLALENRRAAVQAAWNIAQKPSLGTIQTACDAWKNGGVTVSYAGGTVGLAFTGEYGVPANLDALIDALRRTVPAHLGISYQFRYLLIGEVEGMTLEDLETMTLDKFAGGDFTAY